MMGTLTPLELLDLFGHFLVLSLLAVGGAISTAPDMHRYLVVQQGWLDDAQFSAAIALAQAAPGPNLLFVPVLGWSAGGPLGALAALVGIMLPSSTLTLWASRWGRDRQDSRAVRAFTLGLAPLTLGLLLATGWLLLEPALRGFVAGWQARQWLPATGRALGTLGLVGVAMLAMRHTKLSPAWLVALGAVVGAVGWA
jgi:chromate transporter